VLLWLHKKEKQLVEPQSGKQPREKPLDEQPSGKLHDEKQRRGNQLVDQPSAKEKDSLWFN